MLFPWQRYESPDEFEKREERYTEEEKEYRLELAEPSDQCAKQSGLYEAQDAAWLVEVERLVKEEPEEAKPLVDAGVLRVLKEPGVAPFLKLRHQ